MIVLCEHCCQELQRMLCGIYMWIYPWPSMHTLSVSKEPNYTYIQTRIASTPLPYGPARQLSIQWWIFTRLANQIGIPTKEYWSWSSNYLTPWWASWSRWSSEKAIEPACPTPHPHSTHVLTVPNEYDKEVFDLDGELANEGFQSESSDDQNDALLAMADWSQDQPFLGSWD